MKTVTGTKEWADRNHNLQTGYEHDCAYCYAGAMAVRFGRCKAADWKEPHNAKAEGLR